MNCPDCGATVDEEDPFPKERPTDESLLPEEAKEQVDEGLTLPPPPAPGAPSPVPRAKDTRQSSRAGLGLVGLLAIGLYLVGRLVTQAIWAPDATPTPAVMTPAPGAVIYQDDFEDPSTGWTIDNDGDTLALYQDGEYRVAVFRENYVAWGNPAPALDLGDFQIEVDARAVEGPLDNSLGILVRYQDDDKNFYWFQISSDGRFAVDRLAEGEWVSVAGWQESTAIQQGLDATNRLKVSCSGDRFVFSVNGTSLGTVTDRNLGPGNIGLAAGTLDEPGVVVHFDNLRVYAPEE